MRTALTILAALAATASAGQFKINNWCNVPVFVYLSNGGSCNKGPNGQCQGQGGAPFRINSREIKGFDWIRDSGTSVKISKNDEGFGSGILQFEYTYATRDGLYWDLSDLDGRGPGLVGTPFFNDNVKLSPTGNGEGRGTCVKIRCRAGQVCLDSYQVCFPIS